MKKDDDDDDDSDEASGFELMRNTLPSDVLAPGIDCKIKREMLRTLTLDIRKVIECQIVPPEWMAVRFVSDW